MDSVEYRRRKSLYVYCYPVPHYDQSSHAIVPVIPFTASAFAVERRIFYFVFPTIGPMHTVQNGDPVVQTPAFDRMRERVCGLPVLFATQRAGLPEVLSLPARRSGDLRAGNIHSTLPAKFATIRKY